ncbi:MAG: hypothetical protein NVS3B21_23080 [Acidimicrobiales bacterium]
MSDAFLDDAERLEPDEADGLRSLGWGEPTDGLPNWRLEWTAPTPADIASVASIGVRTLREVFGLEDDDRVVVKLPEIRSSMTTESPIGSGAVMTTTMTLRGQSARLHDDYAPGHARSGCRHHAPRQPCVARLPRSAPVMLRSSG